MAKDSLNDREVVEDTLADDVDVPVPPDGGYGWVVLVAAFFVSLIIDGCMYSFGLILPHVREFYGSTQGEANLITSLNTGFLFLSGSAVSGFSNQFGCRSVIMAGSIVASAMYVLSSFAPNIIFMMFSFGVVGGIAMGCTYIPSILIIAMYFDKKRGLATGITMAGSGVGAFLFAPFTEYLLRTFDWRITIIILGCIVLQCCILGAICRPVEVKKKKGKKLLEMEDLNNKSGELKRMTASGRSINITDEDMSRPMNKKDVLYTGSVQSLAEYSKSKNHKDFRRSMQSIPKEDEPNACLRIKLFKVIFDVIKEMSDFSLLAQNKQFLLIALANFFVFVGYFIPFIYIPIRAKDLNMENSSWILSIIGIVNIPSRIAFGTIADRKWISAFNLNTFSFIVCAVANWLFFALTNFWSQAVYGVVFAIGIAGMNSLTSVYLCDIVGLEKLTNSFGIVAIFRGLGCFLGPYVGGFISDKTNSNISAFLFSGLMFTIGVFLVLLITIIRLFKSLCNKKLKGDVLQVDDPKVDTNLLQKV